MTDQYAIDPDPTDAVITWVDGNDPSHRALREQHLASASAPAHENAINPHRWACNGEIFYCLRSLGNHAPWLRTIWIVVEDRLPDLSGLPKALQAKIRRVTHRELFEGFEDNLPTFNSLAIETLLWRIPDLAEQFLYFNDDVFLTAPMSCSDVFRNGAPVLRGRWRNYSNLEASASSRTDPALFNHWMQINAAKAMGLKADHLFASAHVGFPMRRTVMANLYARHPELFSRNVSHRFRDLSQFLPQSLHNHQCLLSNNAVVLDDRDYIHIPSGAGTDGTGDAVRRDLRRATTPEIKFLCINDLPQLESIIPDARDWIWRAIGP